MTVAKTVTRLENRHKVKQKSERLFRNTFSNKRKIRSRANVICTEDKHAFFVTVTSGSVLENNDALKLFIKNLVQNNYVKRYIWVREASKKIRPHYHCIFTSDRNYIPIHVLQKAWKASCLSCGIDYSNNAIHMGKKNKGGGKRKGIKIKNPIKASKYISKYMGKLEEPSKTRLCGCSLGIPLYSEVGSEVFNYLQMYSSGDLEHCRVYYFTVYADFFSCCKELVEFNKKSIDDYLKYNHNLN
jgi:hypothetical protein